MTEAVDQERVTAILDLIDRGLGDMSARELVSTSEVADLLLDVRTLLANANAEAVSAN